MIYQILFLSCPFCPFKGFFTSMNPDVIFQLGLMHEFLATCVTFGASFCMQLHMFSYKVSPENFVTNTTRHIIFPPASCSGIWWLIIWTRFNDGWNGWLKNPFGHFFPSTDTSRPGWQRKSLIIYLFTGLSGKGHDGKGHEGKGHEGKGLEGKGQPGKDTKEKAMAKKFL